MNVTFHTVLHFSDHANNGVNAGRVQKGGFYPMLLRCAMTLARSLREMGGTLIVHTNAPERVAELLRTLKSGEFPEVRRLTECLVPPDGIAFYSAHHKLNLYKVLGMEKAGVHIVVDIDVVIVAKLPDWTVEAMGEGAALVYDITSQVIPGIGLERIRDDLRRVRGGPRLPNGGRWFGGEFIGGDAQFFKFLSDGVDALWPNYCRDFAALHHQGDEVLTSAVLQDSYQFSVRLIDLGAMGVVRRHWSVSTRHDQPPLRRSAELCLLHLPADKSFLAQCQLEHFTNGAEKFWISYRRVERRRRLFSVLKGLLARR